MQYRFQNCIILELLLIGVFIISLTIKGATRLSDACCMIGTTNSTEYLASSQLIYKLLVNLNVICYIDCKNENLMNSNDEYRL